MKKNSYHSVQTVTEITRSIKVLLENGFSFVAVSGEVSNLRKPYSGHIYFTLKDPSSQIKAVFFKKQQRYLSNNLKDGDQVICHGRVSVYEPRGDYQLIIDTVDFAGSGSLQAAVEQLKQKLSAEGLFDQNHKKDLPLLPKKIALITSPQGAAVHDFITTAQRRFPGVAIEIHPVSVQGEMAAQEIINALTKVHEGKSCDIAVICRGGGSIEDLMAFNNENLSRAVFDASIPVISAIGHEIDFTILDFVADHRAPTPTAAAELAVPDSKALKKSINNVTRQMAQSLSKKIDNNRMRLSYQCRLLQDPGKAMSTLRIRIDNAQDRLIRQMQDYLIPPHREQVSNLQKDLQTHIQILLERCRSRFLHSKKTITTVSPETILKRGYSIVTTKKDQTLVTSHKQVSKGDQLEVKLYDGDIDCQVK